MVGCSFYLFAEDVMIGSSHAFYDQAQTTSAGEQTVRPSGFTLIELLVVIAIIATLIGLTFPAIRAVNRTKLIHSARAQLAQVETYINAYKTKLGHYPPDNRNPFNNELYAGLNQLYYELAGTVLINNDTFVSKDRTSPALTPLMISSFFGAGVAGFVNSDRGNTDDGPAAIQFLKDFNPNMVVPIALSNTATKMTVTANILVCTLRGTDPNNPPLTLPLNPWRYNSSSPSNNIMSFDLWTDILVNGQVIRICNWTSKPLVIQ